MLEYVFVAMLTVCFPEGLCSTTRAAPFETLTTCHAALAQMKDIAVITGNRKRFDYIMIDAKCIQMEYYELSGQES